MTIDVKPPVAALAEIIPPTAPFSDEQRQWLNGFFAGLMALDTGTVTAVTMESDADDEETPWHDPAMAITERMALAEGKPLKQRLFAAMAQQDCGQCGYVCATYSAAIAEGGEARLNLCAPGGKETLRMLKALTADAPPAAPAVQVAPSQHAEPAARGSDRDNPAQAVFLSRTLLNGPGSEKETYHVAFDITPDGLDYTAGDSFGVFARNDPRLVDAVIGQLGARPDAPVGTATLRETLITERALGPASDALFQLISFVSGGATRATAKRLAAGEDPDGDLDRLDVLGALHKFRGARLGAEAFVEALDALQPRLYSISSSPKAQPGQLTLTVDAVRYIIGQRPRWGVASTYLGERAQPGERLNVYVQRAHGFALPADPAVPIIMVGPGTGVAPFRAFLQEREAVRAPGRNWLFFGHQRSDSDFYYRDEFNAMKDRGALAQLTLAWSRDGAEKIYVQDRMRENGAELFAWLEAGAHFYVCGDATRMARDVERALVDIIAAQGGRSTDGAVAYVAHLKKAGRYQADVY